MYKIEHGLWKKRKFNSKQKIAVIVICCLILQKAKQCIIFIKLIVKNPAKDFNKNQKYANKYKETVDNLQKQ